MVEFQYFEGCPHYKKTLANLRQLINEGFINEKEVEIKNIQDVESAKEIHFQGSPTILFNGIDIYTEKEPTSYDYSCRIYKFENKFIGTLSKEFIKRQISKFTSR